MYKTRDVENTGSSGKNGVWWKTRGVENTGSGGKHGVSVENLFLFIYVFIYLLNFAF